MAQVEGLRRELKGAPGGRRSTSERVWGFQ
jgi:hypothetical protein